MGVKNEMIGARDEFIALIKKELLGPGSEVSVPDAEHELITASPEKRYSVGILFPQGRRMKADNGDVDSGEEENGEETGDDVSVTEETLENSDYAEKEIKEEKMYGDDDDDDPDSEDNLDEEVSLAAQNMPSSFGIAFFVKGNTDRIHVSLKYGTYRGSRMEDCRIPFLPMKPDGYRVPEAVSGYVTYDASEGTLKMLRGFNRRDVRVLKESDRLDTDDDHIIDNMYKLADQLKSGYVREPHELKDIVIAFGDSDYADSAENLDSDLVGITALRRRMENGNTSLTVMVINKKSGYAASDSCMFQPELKVESTNNEFIFAEYAGNADFDILDDEEQSLELQYRNKHVYGTGLGTAVNWGIDETGNGYIENDFFPEFEVPSMDFNLPGNCGVDPRTLSMKYLSDLDGTDRKEKISNLESLVSAYSAWIDELVNRADTLDGRAGSKIQG